MPTFKEISKDFKVNKVYRAFFETMKQERFKNWIIEEIHRRVVNAGIDADGQVLKTDSSTDGVYSNYTKFVKDGKGQKFSNVTLEDTGVFWNSLVVQIKGFAADLKADFMKEGQHMYNNFQDLYVSKMEFENAILRLGDFELEEFLIDIIFTDFTKRLKEIL